MPGRDAAAVGVGGGTAAGCAQRLTLAQRCCFDPIVCGGVVEQVGGGGVDDLGAALGLDLQVVQVSVVVDHHRGDGLGLVFAGAGVAGQDRIARLQR